MSEKEGLRRSLFGGRPNPFLPDVDDSDASGGDDSSKNGLLIEGSVRKCPVIKDICGDLMLDGSCRDMSKCPDLEDLQ